MGVDSRVAVVGPEASGVSTVAYLRPQQEAAIDVPLVIDLDGTLIRTDLLVESAFAHLGENPLRILRLFTMLMRGKAALKAGIAAETPIDPLHLPYDERVLALIEKARLEGRKIYIASASNERYVSAIADYVRADGFFASTESENLSSHTKASRLVEAFGQMGFDYAGNSHADLPVWAICRKGWAVHPAASVRRALAASGADVAIVEPSGGAAKAWIRLMRVHQWIKNALVFVPLLTAHKLEIAALVQAMGAFFAFSFAASAVYLLNDLVDLEADRKHPSKKRRPLAAGTLPIRAALPVIVLLVLIAFNIALIVEPFFAGVLLGYLGLTTAYTFFLKRKMLVDVVALALLYTIRVVGGAVAISVPVSEWLLAFALFIFTSLALLKRYVELAARADADLPDPSNRNYRKSDLGIVATLAAAAGFNAVTVFALYISSDTVRQLYRHPDALWLVCPILMYWLARALIMANRRLMNDDPIVFALKDRNSLLAFAVITAIIVGAA
ncbi:UbiA family prenyltransferase [Bradyrhizobium sp. BWC-3-1]|uniref:UbiA family prenyltransferase n=1 Tax=Bradyrhizobium sp. BWC-3-1 TaxID=3080012 RepID=UPI00293E70E8|nr:UbiA family prenyltransferase [Bradyrhizobium sp. BWC-3-1]WOH56089.1 UbiA family prenyltransferase [Bradyrhizobium sp. BWC-3-1]